CFSSGMDLANFATVSPIPSQCSEIVPLPALGGGGPATTGFAAEIVIPASALIPSMAYYTNDLSPNIVTTDGGEGPGTQHCRHRQCHLRRTRDRSQKQSVAAMSTLTRKELNMRRRIDDSGEWDFVG